MLLLSSKLQYITILLKEPFALKNSETVYFTSIFSTLSYSDIVLIDNFDLIFFYFYFVFENFGNNFIFLYANILHFKPNFVCLNSLKNIEKMFFLI